MRDSPERVAGIRFRNAGKIFYFDSGGMRLEVGEYVVVETTRGPEVGRVVIAPGQVVVNEMGREELKPILRLATDDDIRRMDRLRQQAQEILPEARRIAEDIGFPARIDAADFTLDGRRLTFSFTSEERLDYRDFLRRTSEQFNVKVDMRQLGARDRAKLAGGYGICGRELCCSSWLATFPSISIRMAKEQELPLNPQKISGLCGRLLCCLSYEEEGYKEMRKTLPKVGQRCSTPTGEGKVIAVNILRRQVTLLVDRQRIEVPDRDLGTVVRWDTSSKSAAPPPSISREEAIAQGLIEATEDDLHAAESAAVGGDWLPADVPVGSGRGRLPGGGPRREARKKPTPAEQAPAPQPERSGPRRRGKGGQGRGEPDANRQQGGGHARGQRERPARNTPPPGLPQGRAFRRADSAPLPPAPSRAADPPASPRSAEGDGAPRDDAARRRRGRRAGRGRNQGDTPDGGPQGE
jgi:cell fate regulator YaaT (PSP1 superfamily)